MIPINQTCNRLQTLTMSEDSPLFSSLLYSTVLYSTLIFCSLLISPPLNSSLSSLLLYPPLVLLPLFSFPPLILTPFSSPLLHLSWVSLLTDQSCF